MMAVRAAPQGEGRQRRDALQSRARTNLRSAPRAARAHLPAPAMGCPLNLPAASPEKPTATTTEIQLALPLGTSVQVLFLLPVCSRGAGRQKGRPD